MGYTTRLVSRKNLDLRGFLIDCAARGLSPHTLAFYRNELQGFWAFLGSVEAQDVTLNDIRLYLLTSGQQEDRRSRAPTISSSTGTPSARIR